MKHYVRNVMTCDCRICKQRKEFVGQLDILRENGLNDSVTYFEDIYLELMNIGMDNDVNKSIIEGSWPTADENIKYARIRYENRNNKS